MPSLSTAPGLTPERGLRYPRDDGSREPVLRRRGPAQANEVGGAKSEWQEPMETGHWPHAVIIRLHQPGSERLKGTAEVEGVRDAVDERAGAVAGRDGGCPTTAPVRVRRRAPREPHADPATTDDAQRCDARLGAASADVRAADGRPARRDGPDDDGVVRPGDESAVPPRARRRDGTDGVAGPRLLRIERHVPGTGNVAAGAGSVGDVSATRGDDSPAAQLDQSRDLPRAGGARAFRGEQRSADGVEPVSAQLVRRRAHQHAGATARTRRCGSLAGPAASGVVARRLGADDAQRVVEGAPVSSEPSGDGEGGVSSGVLETHGRRCMLRRDARPCPPLIHDAAEP